MKENKSRFLVFSSVAMGSQLMNSILYMSQYFIQSKTIGSVNYDSPNFPTGKYLLGRPFMYVNVFWTLMPLYVIIMEYVLYGKECLCCYVRNRRGYYKHKMLNTKFNIYAF